MRGDLWQIEEVESRGRVLNYMRSPPNGDLYIVDGTIYHNEMWPASLVVDEDGPFCILDKRLAPDELACLLDGTLDAVEFARDLMH